MPFSESIYKSLVSHKAHVLESLHLKIFGYDESVARDIRKCIEIAFARHMRRFVLGIGSLDSTISLCSVEYNDDASLCNLLCGCPILEDLYMSGISNDHTFTIAAPSLQRLTIEHVFTMSGYVINAPCLKILVYQRFPRSRVFFLIDESNNAPKLVEEATIIDVLNITNDNFFASLTSAIRLSLCLSPSQIKYPSGCIFYQLVHLELETRPKEWWNVLSYMLDSSPKLQTLKLIDEDIEKLETRDEVLKELASVVMASISSLLEIIAK
ncbi:unnamed protein product [Cochlearia groenlandica]